MGNYVPEAGGAVSGPTFRATDSVGTPATSTVWTKARLNNEQWDSDGDFDNVTNYRFTPNVAGYYAVSGSARGDGAATILQASIYKNGAAHKTVTHYFPTAGVTNQVDISDTIYLNGTTDFIELYGWQQGGTTLSAGSDMSAIWVRS